MHKRAFWTCTALALRVASVAHADEPSELELRAARELFASAEADEDAGRFTDALGKFQQVLARKRTPGVLYHVATCEEGLGKLASAEAHFQSALRAARAEGASDVEAAASRRLLALAPRVPHVRVVLRTRGLPEVTLDGQKLSMSAWRDGLSVDPGSHTLEAHLREHIPFRASFRMEPAMLREIEVWLAPVRHEPEEPRPRPRRGSFWVAPAIASLVFAAGGLAAYLHAGGLREDALAACAARTTPCEDLRGPVRTWDAIAFGAWGFSAAGAGLSIYTLTRK